MTTEQISLALLANHIAAQHQTIERIDSMLRELMHRTDVIGETMWQMDRRRNAVAQSHQIASIGQAKGRGNARKKAAARRAGMRA